MTLSTHGTTPSPVENFPQGYPPSTKAAPEPLVPRNLWKIFHRFIHPTPEPLICCFRQITGSNQAQRPPTPQPPKDRPHAHHRRTRRHSPATTDPGTTQTQTITQARKSYRSPTPSEPAALEAAKQAIADRLAQEQQRQAVESIAMDRKHSRNGPAVFSICSTASTPTHSHRAGDRRPAAGTAGARNQ